MAKLTKTDLPQSILVTLSEDTADGGVVVQIPTSLTTRDKVGVFIHSIEFINTDYEGLGWPLVANHDSFRFGLTQLYNQGNVPDYDAPGIVFFETIARQDFGTAANGDVEFQPYRMKFEQPPLAHPAALFAFMKGKNQPAALDFYMKIWFSYVDLSPEMYNDIIQTIVIQNAL